MFYSHQLLARKAPLGQIWMAATLHAKINRKKLSKLNIIRICEEILNPSVPMALRLSGILMGGVVIVYERQVKLLLDDVKRLLVELNEAWKVKPDPDPTRLPKGKSQARKEAVTLPENNHETDMGDMEQSVNYSNTAPAEFQRTSYIAMRLDNLDEPYFHNDTGEEDNCRQLHQADAGDITFERFDSYHASTDMYNRFERFDIEGDEETHPNFASGEHAEIPATTIPTPPSQDERQRAEEIQDQHLEEKPMEGSMGNREMRQDLKSKGPVKRKTRQQGAKMDYEQTIIPNHVYQSWLQNASNIVARRGKKKKASGDILSTAKIANLMELPPTVLIDVLSRKGEIYYPRPLVELWRKSTQPQHDSPSVRTSPPFPPEPSSLSPPERVHDQYPMGYIFEDVADLQSTEISREKQRAFVVNDEIPVETLLEDLRANPMRNSTRIPEANSVTPRKSGGDRSSESGHHTPSGRSNKKRPYSSSRRSSGSLEAVPEVTSWEFPDANFKLSRLSENDPTPELSVETGPTQTQHQFISQPIDKMTELIQTHMKLHFETPGAIPVESLNNLASGMNQKQAARFFYQICVLVSLDVLTVEQKVPYGEILISKGAKM